MIFGARPLLRRASAGRLQQADSCPTGPGDHVRLHLYFLSKKGKTQKASKFLRVETRLKHRWRLFPASCFSTSKTFCNENNNSGSRMKLVFVTTSLFWSYLYKLIKLNIAEAKSESIFVKSFFIDLSSFFLNVFGTKPIMLWGAAVAWLTSIQSSPARRETERERQRVCVCVCVRMCVYVFAHAREPERARQRETNKSFWPDIKLWLMFDSV